jgi:type I restriction enzyme, S subunit
VIQVLPKKWESWRLGDIGQWSGGGTPSSSHAAFWNGDIPWVSPKDMKVSAITTTQDHITQAAVESSAAKLIAARSVLFVTRSGILAHSFPVATTRVRVTINQDLKAITPIEVIEPEYLAWALRASEKRILRSCSKHGTTVHSIEMPALKSLSVPVPPLPEQRRIIAKLGELLSELDKGVESLNAAREQMKGYRQSILKYAFEGKLTRNWGTRSPDKVLTPEARVSAIRADRFGEAVERHERAMRAWDARGKKGTKPRMPQPYEIVANPEIPDDLLKYCTERWAWLRLGDVSRVTGGLTKSPKRSALSMKMKYLRVGNVYEDRLELGAVAEIGVTKEEFANLRLEPGDMLVVEGNGSVEQIGRVAVWSGELPDVGHQNHLIRVRFAPGMSPRFFLWFLMSPLGRDLIVRKASSTSGLHTLSISKVADLPVPVPSTEEQEALLACLEAPISEIEKLTEEIDQGLARSAALRQAILNQAFSGQLVPQDASDEPASELMQRIRTENARPAPKNGGKRINGKKKAA